MSPQRSPSHRSTRSTAASRDHAASRVEAMLAGVRGAGLKLTPQRLAIVRAIAADPSHPTAQEIFDRLQASMPTMSFATVYNTLDALARAGLCGSLSLSPGPARFDPNMEPHHHAVCDGCGLVRDVDRTGPSDGARAGAPPLSMGPRAPGGRGGHGALDSGALSGFEVRAVEHIYRGLCAECSRRTGPHRPTISR